MKEFEGKKYIFSHGNYGRMEWCTAWRFYCEPTAVHNFLHDSNLQAALRTVLSLGLVKHQFLRSSFQLVFFVLV